MKISSRCTLLVLGLVFVLLALNLSAFAELSESPVECQPGYIEVKSGQEVTFRAAHGNGKYMWVANGGNPRLGNEQFFTTSFKDGGGYSVSVTSGDTTKACNLHVNASESNRSASTGMFWWTGWPWWAKLLLWIFFLLLLAAAILIIANTIREKRRIQTEEETRIRERNEDVTERRTRNSAEDTHRKHEEEVLSIVPDYIHRQDEHMTRQNEFMAEQRDRWAVGDKRRADEEVRVGQLRNSRETAGDIVIPVRVVLHADGVEVHRRIKPELSVDVTSDPMPVIPEAPHTQPAAEPAPSSEVVETTTTEHAAAEPVVVSEPAPAEEVPANAATTMLGTDYRPSDDENPTTRIKRTETETKESAAD